MINPEKKIDRIIKNDYGVNSGVYNAVDSRISMVMDSKGEYKPRFTGDIPQDVYRKLLEVDSMSDESNNETQISELLFSKIEGIKHHSVLGYYSDLYIGHVVVDGYRSIGSSGGITTWILAKLLFTKKITGVIHVHAIDPKKNDGKLFEYTVSSNVKEIKLGAKTRYYPMELSGVLKFVKDNDGVFAITGIPEFITELRLLAAIDPVIKLRIKFMIGLVCGHQKSAKYVEALAWQHGISPGSLINVDFRVKQPKSTAMDYLHVFTGMVDGKKTIVKKHHSELFAENWGAGFFKSKFSDFTDNAFAETADVALGDAWVPEYNIDGSGNNIIIVRHPQIAEVLQKGLKDKEIKIDSVDYQKIIESQQGLMHHVIDELPYRLRRQRSQGKWAPKKRTKPSNKLSSHRKKIQLSRHKIRIESHEAFAAALSKNDWKEFALRMQPLLDEYDTLYNASSSSDKTKSKIIKSNHKISIPRNFSVLTHVRSKLRPFTRYRKIKNSASNSLDFRKERLSIWMSAHKERYEYWKKWRKFRKADGVIVTLNGYFNYGNIVQRFALQEYFKQNSLRFVSYEKTPTNLNWENPVKFKHTKGFIDRYIERKEFDIRDSFPVYIVGSDQVWRNWGYKDERTDLGYFFLSFLEQKNVKRIAYAASLGQSTIEQTGISEDFIDHIRPSISRFDAISVREKSAVQVLQKTWKVKTATVVDPTLLLSKDDYANLIKNSKHKIERVKGIFAYLLLEDQELQENLQKIAHKTKMKITEFFLKNFEVFPPVEQWLSGFRDAQFVITDSFHGVVFSIIFNKNFIVIDNSVGGSARLLDLCEELGIKNRVIVKDQVHGLDIDLLSPIDWEYANEQIRRKRLVSQDWLMDALRKPKKETNQR